ncbi:hypothetical protein GGR56DRAFT_643484 [Xylariaceae sp. FL0804]|nr:hypothetical protein GGR56DRAFT_643484 [Xylariaceae sp. FL0804]
MFLSFWSSYWSLFFSLSFSSFSPHLLPLFPSFLRLFSVSLTECSWPTSLFTQIGMVIVDIEAHRTSLSMPLPPDS